MKVPEEVDPNAVTLEEEDDADDVTNDWEWSEEDAEEDWRRWNEPVDPIDTREEYEELMR